MHLLLLLLLLPPHDARTWAVVPVAGVPGCPIDHLVLRHVPWARLVLAVARLKTHIAALAAVAELVGRVAAIADRGDLSRCSMRAGHGKCASLLLCRRHSRRRAAAGAGWCSVT